MRVPAVTLVVFLAVVVRSVCLGAELESLGHVQVLGEIKGTEDVSAVARVGSFLVIGSDEAVGTDENENFIQLLKHVGTNTYQVHQDILLLKGRRKKGEMDIEGIAVDGNAVYVVGSHSSIRKRIKDNETYETNRERFYDSAIEDETSRDVLCRVTVDSEGRGTTKECKSLRDIIQADRALRTFSRIPDKENGVNIEGLAVRDGWLYAGFRGPVFRERYVPVMKFRFDTPFDYQLLYVELDGQGIRGMARVSDGFLIVAGPAADVRGPYRLFHWDGKDVIPGKNRAPKDIGSVRLLGGIPVLDNGKAEGIVVLDERPSTYEIIVAYDGIKGGGLHRFRVAKPLP